jgi:hypothetical protein
MGSYERIRWKRADGMLLLPDKDELTRYFSSGNVLLHPGLQENFFFLLKPTHPSWYMQEEKWHAIHQKPHGRVFAYESNPTGSAGFCPTPLPS